MSEGFIGSMFSRKFERRVYIAVGVFTFSGALGVSFGAYILWPEHREAGYEPEQPIQYSHKLHAGTLRIECLYCHTGKQREPTDLRDVRIDLLFGRSQVALRLRVDPGHCL